MQAIGVNSDGQSPALPLRRTVFAGLSVFILLAPALPQIFGIHSVFLRPWIMYSNVGAGALKGSFTLTLPDRTVSELQPIDLHGGNNYPRYRPVYGAESLREFAAEFCAGLPEGAALTFEGARGSRHGWIAIGGQDLCAGAPE